MPAAPRDTAAFRHPDKHSELARLKRLTGLEFDSVPVSLLQPEPAATQRTTTSPEVATVPALRTNAPR